MGKDKEGAATVQSNRAESHRGDAGIISHREYGRREMNALAAAFGICFALMALWEVISSWM